MTERICTKYTQYRKNIKTVKTVNNSPWTTCGR